MSKTLSNNWLMPSMDKRLFIHEKVCCSMSQVPSSKQMSVCMFSTVPNEAISLVSAQLLND